VIRAARIELSDRGREAAFQTLRDLRLPPLRTFQSIQLNEELRKLADRIVEKA
jgi:hypothetical protein